MEGGTGFFLQHHFPVLSSGGTISLKADKGSSSWSSGLHSEAPGEAAHYATPMLLGELWERGEARRTASVCTKNIL